MSQIHPITMMLGKGITTTAQVSIDVAVNLEFLKELSRRILGLETARKNANARQILAEDYADHDLVYGAAQTRLRIHKVFIDCSSGYYHAPYVILQTKDETKVFGRVSTDDLAAILAMPEPESAKQLEAA